MKKLNEETAIKAIQNKDNLSVAAVLREIKMSDRNGTNYQKIYDIANKYNLDTSHWLGKSINKNKKLGFKRPICDYLNNKISIASHNLKIRLFDERIKEKRCENCNQTKWLEQEIPLELHHIDGSHYNNNLDNLKILCPNCHALTPNFCSKNISHIKRQIRRVTENEIIEAIKLSQNYLQVLNKIGLSAAAGNYNRVRNIKEKLGIDFLPEIEKVEIESNDDWRNSPRFHTRKVQRPSKEELLILVSTKSMLEITKIYGLKSDNSIRKWCDAYGIDYQSISPFSFKNKNLNPSVTGTNTSIS